MYIRNFFKDRLKSLSSSDERIIDLIEKNMDTVFDMPIKSVMLKADVSPSSLYNFLKKNNVEKWSDLENLLGAVSNSNSGFDTESNMFRSIKYFLNWNYDEVLRTKIHKLISDIYKYKKIIIYCRRDQKIMGEIFKNNFMSRGIDVLLLSDYDTESAYLLTSKKSSQTVRLALLSNANIELFLSFINARRNLGSWSILSKDDVDISKKLSNIDLDFTYRIKSVTELPVENRPSWEYGFLLVLDLIKHGLDVNEKIHEVDNK